MGTRRKTTIKTKVITFSSNIESTDNMEVALVSKRLNEKRGKIHPRTGQERNRPVSLVIIFTLIYKTFFLFFFFHIIFTFVPCILILSKFFYSPTDAQVNCLKTILTFTLKQFRYLMFFRPCIIV